MKTFYAEFRLFCNGHPTDCTYGYSIKAQSEISANSKAKRIARHLARVERILRPEERELVYLVDDLYEEER